MVKGAEKTVAAEKMVYVLRNFEKGLLVEHIDTGVNHIDTGKVSFYPWREVSGLSDTGEESATLFDRVHTH